MTIFCRKLNNPSIKRLESSILDLKMDLFVSVVGMSVIFRVCSYAHLLGSEEQKGSRKQFFSANEGTGGEGDTRDRKRRLRPAPANSRPTFRPNRKKI